MRIFRRLRNLWRMSDVDVPKRRSETKKIIKDIFQPHAKVVNMENPIEKIEL